MDPVTIITYILVIILLFLCLYYLYKFLNGDSDVTDVVIWESPTDGLPTGATVGGSNLLTIDGAKQYNAASGSAVPYIYPGGEYTVSTWIYVTKWDNNKNKPFLTLSGNGTGVGTFMTLLLFLGKSTNKLGVRVSNGDALNQGLQLNATEYAAMLNGTGNYRDEVYNVGGDIEEVNLQRWVNITVVMMGKTLDVYIDGKLSRSTVLPSSFTANNPEAITNNPPQTLTLGDKNSFRGYLGMTRAANYAYTPDRVYANYQHGPFKGWSLSSMDITQYSLTVKKNDSVIFEF